MDIILVPGLWLDASSWDGVLPAIEGAGHRAHPLTPPGLTRDADRTQVSLADQVGSVVAAIDACDDGPVLLVGHSLGCAVASAAVDARVDRVARAVYVGGWPAAGGRPIAAGFDVVDGELPFPDLSAFGDEDLAGFDPEALESFRRNAIPSPARLTTDVLELHDERRYDVPVTEVCTEYTAAQLQEWLAAGEGKNLAELSRYRDVTYADLPTGHWPQLTRPADLGGLIARLAG